MLLQILKRTFISLFTVCAVSLIHGLLECAIVLMLTHNEAGRVFYLRIISVAFIICGLLLLLITEGNGTFRRTFIRLIFWGYAIGFLIGVVTGWCLLGLTVLTQNYSMLMSQDFFASIRIYSFCALTVPALLCGKAIWCFLSRFNEKRQWKGQT